MKKFYDQGLHFHCTQCSQCCRGDSGYVFLSKEDIDRITAHLQMSQEDFLTQHARTVAHGNALRISLLEVAESDGQMRCEFWKDGCSIYSARPSQCRTYPFWSSILASQANWNLEAEHCPGINLTDAKLYHKDEIENLLANHPEERLIQIKP
ncbi:YkgJ family cysteine cluster protein [Entomospira culicis]|uniref:YkgJ family cysteine cluster protein n=1 Tax=Entomospira culicis TaxID=2719989 RepID=A0A968GFV5_9SPIO|nr:YkgJ family cysteine cluster protein [Entomospira culicis]NIZ19274.1 YkgJ family cysteine cluster protein [Entomospira culicis]NIZ69821.1 YkgJ family cysteine cluster protein [Entomospira culicis]WDI36928.1 YkgJ family cysteine cluster protein [Entomospira culicis]WDI38557.1 YkgJ family cysteine cluster protein [Entomospira culicis]